MAVQNNFPEGVRVALIGYGVGGAVFHAPLISCVPGMKLSAIVTRSPAKQNQAATDFPGAKILADAEQIFAEAGQYDMVVVTSPNSLHFTQARAALQAGLHVVIDKPMATTAAHCEELKALAEKKNLLLTVFHNRRLDGDLLTVKKIIDEDLLGPLARIESRFDRYRPQARGGVWRESGAPEDGGGLLFDLGSHLIDQMIYLFGQPQQVYCELDTRRAGVQSDDDCFVSLGFASGLRAQLWASVLCRIKAPRFHLYGDRGSFVKYGLDPQEDALRAGLRPSAAADGGDWGRENENSWGEIYTTEGGVTIKGKIETEAGAYQRFYQDLEAALRAKNYSLAPVPAGQVCQTARIIEAAFESARKRTVVQL